MGYAREALRGCSPFAVATRNYASSLKMSLANAEIIFYIKRADDKFTESFARIRTSSEGIKAADEAVKSKQII